MSRQPIPLHGRTHLPGGSDPIPNQPTIAAAINISGTFPTSVASGSQFSTETHVLFNNVLTDNYDMVDLGSNADRITAVRDGLHLVFAEVFWSTSASDTSIRYMATFGTETTFNVGVTAKNIASQGLRQAVTAWYDFEVGDYVYVGVTQESGSSVDVVTAAFSMVFIPA